MNVSYFVHAVSSMPRRVPTEQQVFSKYVLEKGIVSGVLGLGEPAKKS